MDIQRDFSALIRRAFPTEKNAALAIAARIFADQVEQELEKTRLAERQPIVFPVWGQW